MGARADRKGGFEVAWPSILSLLALFDALLSYLVEASVQFDKATDGQWVLVHLHSSLTNKGVAALDALVTIIHNVLDFVAQVTTLLPAPAGELLY